jgi:alpha-glucosidase (family GH31 glycosyl hydrolase)
MFDDESSVILSKFTKLKNRLEPYLTTLSIEGVVKQGHPIMRATFLEFPDDPVAWMLDQQYMLGHALLVAPIFDDREVEYYVPRGSWVNVLTGTVVTGPGFVTETHSFSTLPLLLRQNTGLIIGREGHTVLDKISDVNKGFTVIVGSNSDENFEVTAFLRDGHQITAHVAVEKDENAKTTSLTVVITSSALKELSWEILVVGNGSSLGEPRLLFSPTGPGRCNISLLAV